MEGGSGLDRRDIFLLQVLPRIDCVPALQGPPGPCEPRDSGLEWLCINAWPHENRFKRPHARLPRELTHSGNALWDRRLGVEVGSTLTDSAEAVREDPQVLQLRQVSLRPQGVAAKRSLVPHQHPKVGGNSPPFHFTQCDVSGVVTTPLVSKHHHQDSPQKSESRKWCEVGPRCWQFRVELTCRCGPQM